MTTSMETHCRTLAAHCRRDASWLRGGAITGAFTTAFCVYASLPNLAIAVAALAALLEFITRTLLHDAKVLELLADHYDEDP